MENVINRGLNFTILPFKLDITEVLVDFKNFARSMIWQEFWYGRNENYNDNPTEDIFKDKNKRNLPKNYQVPKGLQVFPNSVKSEILDPRNRNPTKCNIPPEEAQALKDLVRLQRERIITIKECDKGAGVIILDFNDYVNACYEHLKSEQKQPDGSMKSYYKKVDELMLMKSEAEITAVLKEALNNNIINDKEYQAMVPTNKDAARFYMKFKVHKTHEEGKVPPPRPIVSCNNSITENIGLYVEHQIKELSTKHETYLKDTPEFLRAIDSINKGQKLPKKALLVAIDAIGLYTNIPKEDVIDSLSKTLEERENKTIPTRFILDLMELILKYSIFSFNSEYFQQEIGAAMGSRPIPHYANNFMAKKIDRIIIDLTTGKGNPLLLFKRFLDDLFFIFNGSTKELHELFDKINQIHPAMKFTMEHTSLETESLSEKCDCTAKKAIQFLDTSCEIQNGKIETDLYRKVTDRNQYLLPSSCHPKQTTSNITFSLCLRIVRICNKP